LSKILVAGALVMLLEARKVAVEDCTLGALVLMLILAADLARGFGRSTDIGDDFFHVLGGYRL